MTKDHQSAEAQWGFQIKAAEHPQSSLWMATPGPVGEALAALVLEASQRPECRELLPDVAPFELTFRRVSDERTGIAVRIRLDDYERRDEGWRYSLERDGQAMTFEEPDPARVIASGHDASAIIDATVGVLRGEAAASNNG